MADTPSTDEAVAVLIGRDDRSLIRIIEDFLHAEVDDDMAAQAGRLTTQILAAGFSRGLSTEDQIASWRRLGYEVFRTAELDAGRAELESVRAERDNLEIMLDTAKHERDRLAAVVERVSRTAREALDNGTQVAEVELAERMLAALTPAPEDRNFSELTGHPLLQFGVRWPDDGRVFIYASHGEATAYAAGFGEVLQRRDRGEWLPVPLDTDREAT